jgi:Aspartyl protease
MLEGRFGNTTTAPYLEGHIFFPRLGLRGLVSFLVDTGADGTVLMPADSKKLNVNFRSLRNPNSSQGVGGDSARIYRRCCFDILRSTLCLFISSGCCPFCLY